MISMLLFPLHIAGLQILRPVLTPLFEVQQIPLFHFSITYPDKFIFQIHKSSAILIHCLDEIFMCPSLLCNGGKKLLQG